MNTNLRTDLARLGDQLEHAVAVQIGGSIASRRRRKLRSRTTIAGLVVVGVLGTAGAAAAAVSLLSTTSVEHGMPGSTQIFVGTDPTCTTKDHQTFDCTLGKSPGNALADWTGTKESFNDDQNNVAGGCVGLNKAGTKWTCYAGQLAVDKQTIGPALLGVHSSGPAVG
ncbi:MAG: hypothetical protein JWR35_3519 [Marmoricola sp.]|jgi:hypothetical protein|nr:hypothetical protein [Marmoricola sp.]